MIDAGRASLRRRMIALKRPRLYELTIEEKAWLFLARITPCLDEDEERIINWLTPVQSRKRRFGAA